MLCKNGGTDRDAVWNLTFVDPRNHLLDGGLDRTNPFAAVRGDNTAMRPFTNFIWTLALFSFPCGRLSWLFVFPAHDKYFILNMHAKLNIHFNTVLNRIVQKRRLHT